MGSAFMRVNVITEGINIGLIAIIILHGNFNFDIAILFEFTAAFTIDNFIM